MALIITWADLVIAAVGNKCVGVHVLISDQLTRWHTIGRDPSDPVLIIGT